MIIFVLTLILNCLSVEADNNIIYWSEGYKLSYEDFKQNVPKEALHSGMSATGFGYACKFDDDSLLIETKTIFNKDQSWLLEKDSATLKHEQGHFDISEIYCRKLRKEIMELCQSKIDESKISLQVSTLYEKYYSKCLLEQDAYDDAVKESIYEEKQFLWNEKIKAYLDEYSSFKERSLKFHIDKN